MRTAGVTASRWMPDALAGIGAFALAMIEANQYGNVAVPYPAAGYSEVWAPVVVAMGLGAAVGLSRAQPGVALAVAWFTGLFQVLVGVDAFLSEVLFGVVAFGCARWGRVPTVWLSALSIPASAAIAVLLLSPYRFYVGLQRLGINGLAEDAFNTTGSFGLRGVAALIGLAVLALPWLVGLALRLGASSEDSRRSQIAAEAQRDQAEEIARLQEEQARLARDVHDVVGHSLAVILAQAESAQYLEDADTQGLKATMANIVTSARSSLEDVRHVLSSTAQQPGTAPAHHSDLDSLIAGVQASGHEVVATEVGTPQPMPPELAVVAFRVLQEMLTNAIKHGPRDQPVHVECHWDDDLRIEVRNAVTGEDRAHAETQPLVAPPPGPAPGPVPAPAPAPAASGQGLEGMRRRLEAVGGRLDVRRRSDPPSFTATAWVPVRSR